MVGRSLALLFTFALLACGSPETGGTPDGDAPPPPDGSDLRCGSLALHTAQACDDQGWCWSLPRQGALDIRHGYAAPNGELWLVGAGADPMRWSASEWRLLPLPGEARGTEGVRVEGVGDSLWVLSPSGLFAWDDGWKAVDTGVADPDVQALWAFSPDDVWVVGSQIRRWDGEAWSTAPARGGPFYDVFGLDDGHAWVVGANGVTFHWDGSTFERVDTGSSEHLRGVWGSGPGDVWAVGERGTLLHWNGHGWRRVREPSGLALTGIAGMRRDEILAVGYDGQSGRSVVLRWNGSRWAELALPSSGRIRSVWSDASGIWLGGDRGLLLLWDGSCFWAPEVDSPLLLNDLAGAGDRLWAVGSGGVAFFRAGEEDWREVASADSVDLRAAWVADDGSAVLVGDSGRILLGSADGALQALPAADRSLRSVDGSRPDDVWIGGNGGALLHWDGRTLRRVPSPSLGVIRSLRVFEERAWAVAGTMPAELLTLRDGLWTRERETGSHPRLFGSAADDLWLLSHAPSGSAWLERWDGERWSVLRSGGPTAVEAIAGDGDALWVASEPGMLHRKEGEGWHSSHLANGAILGAAARGERVAVLVQSGSGASLLVLDGDLQHGSPLEAPRALAFTESGELLLVGEGGWAARWLDGHLEELPTGTAENLNALGEVGGVTWAVGDGGIILRWTAAGWEPEASGTNAHLRAVAEGPRGAPIAVGTRGVIRERKEEGWRSLPSPTGVDLEHAASRDGALWIAGKQSSVFAYEDEKWTTWELPFLPTALWADAAGDLWVGGKGDTHLLRRKEGGWEEVPLGVERAVTMGASAGRGAAWIAGEHGLWRVEADGATEALPLPTARLHGLLHGPGGALWAHGGPGILRYEP